MADMTLAGTKCAAFLDRDGTIVRQVELMHEVSQLSLLPGAAAAIRLLNEKDLQVVVVTNQPVVARGVATEQEIRLVHEELNWRLQAEGGHIDAFYFVRITPMRRWNSTAQSVCAANQNRE